MKNISLTSRRSCATWPCWSSRSPSRRRGWPRCEKCSSGCPGSRRTRGRTKLADPRPPVPVDADLIMRNLVLKNQVVVGTVNADREAFEGAIRDLGIFLKRWPTALRALITGRYKIDQYRDLLLGKVSGIKNVIALV